jgi:hypothetical protein
MRGEMLVRRRSAAGIQQPLGGRRQPLLPERGAHVGTRVSDLTVISSLEAAFSLDESPDRWPGDRKRCPPAHRLRRPANVPGTSSLRRPGAR